MENLLSLTRRSNNYQLEESSKLQIESEAVMHKNDNQGYAEGAPLVPSFKIGIQNQESSLIENGDVHFKRYSTEGMS